MIPVRSWSRRRSIRRRAVSTISSGRAGFIIVSVTPFVGIVLGVVGLLIAFPELTLWLPRLMAP